MVSKEQKLYRQILWFDSRRRFDIDFFELLQPQRVVSEHHRYNSGLFYSEKGNRQIQYESGLELAFIKQLEGLKNVAFYYEQPVQLKYRRGRRKVTYTPDFGIYLTTGEFVLAEVKALPDMLDHRVQQKTEALLEYCSEKGFGLLLTDGRHTIDRLRKTKLNRKLEREILKAVSEDVLRKKQVVELLQACSATQGELHKVILRNHLKFSAFPLKLQRGNKNEVFRRVFTDRVSYNRLVERYPTLNLKMEQ